MGFFFWKKKQEPQSTEGEISPPPSDSSLNPSPENKDRKTQKAERYFNKGLEFLNSTSYKDRALQQFINAGNLGYIDAIHYIGLCYFKGYGTPSNPERAVEIWQKNVLKKNPLTQYMLGYCYFHGIGIERNRIVARAYLKTAEALGNTDASILLKEDIPSQASSASSAPTHEPGFLKITVRDDKYDIQYENARAAVCKQSEGYLFSEKSTIKQNSRYDSQEVIKRRKSWEFARLLVPQEPDLLVLWVDQNSRLTSISQVVEFISGKKIHIPDEASLNLMKEWKRGDPVIEYPLFPKDKVTGTNPPDKNKVTETDLPTEYAEYQNVTDEYARAVFFLVESLITDNPIKGKYFQAGREKLVRLAKSGNKPANELLNSLLDNDKYQLLSPEMDIRTSRSILDSLYPETRYQIFFAGANCGGIRAKTELGKCYRNGIGVRSDVKKAEFWFISAAQGGNAEAKTLLRQLKYPPSKPVQQETSRSQPSTAPRPQFDSSFVLFEEADILYKHALAYYVGDITNRTNITKYMNYLRIAEELGSKQAAFLLKTEESFCYTHLEAARYGSKKAEKHISYIASTGRIPVDIVTQYVRYINARTPSDDYYKFSNTSPDIAQKVYQRGLSYWVGDVYSWTDGTKGNEYLRIARDLGSHDAEFILNSEHKRLYIYLEAAKYGSLKAKKKVREWNDKKTFAGKIPDEKLREYFQTIGLPTAGIKSAEEFFQEGLRQETSLSQSSKTATKSHPSESQSPTSQTPAYQLNTTTPWDARNIARSFSPSLNTQKEETSPQSSKTATPKLDSSFVLFKEADMLYKRALAYYVGDINGKFDSKNFHDYLELAVQFGSEQAKFLLNTDEKHYYAHLDAARYGSAEAKRYMQQGEIRRRLIGRIPGDILRQYFNFIDSNETSTYYYRTGHVPSQKYVEELYHLGLSYLVGDVTGRKNVSKSDACLQIAKDSGSQDAKFILDSPCKERYIYLEAAKYGSERAKRKVIELNQKGEFNGSIPDEKLKEYFQEIGLTITKFKSVTDSDAEKKSSSGKKSEKIIIDYSSAKDTETRKKTATSGTSTKPRTTSVSKDAEESFRRALNLYVGENGICNINRGFAELKAAKNAGHPEAARILESASVSSQIYLAAAKRGSIPARKQIEIWREKGTLNGKISDAELKEYDKIVKKFSAKPEAQKETKEKQLIPEKPSAVKPVPKENTPKPAPKKPKKKTKIVIDKERLQEVKAEHLYTQNRLAVDYGEEEPMAKPEPVPVKPKAPARAEADGEWGQMKSSLSKTHIQILKAILKEPGNVTKQHEIAKESGSMLDILYDEINEISDEILGDLLIDEGELVEEYIEDVKSLCQ